MINATINNDESISSSAKKGLYRYATGDPFPIKKEKKRKIAP